MFFLVTVKITSHRSVGFYQWPLFETKLLTNFTKCQFVYHICVTNNQDNFLVKLERNLTSVVVTGWSPCHDVLALYTVLWRSFLNDIVIIIISYKSPQLLSMANLTFHKDFILSVAPFFSVELQPFFIVENTWIFSVGYLKHKHETIMYTKQWQRINSFVRTRITTNNTLGLTWP